MRCNVRWGWLAVLGFLTAVPAAWADVKLPQIFGDHMVLQQKSDAAVWGWAEPNEEVTVTLVDAKATAKTGADGKWKTKITVPAASDKPLTLSVKGKNEIVLKDVLAGEVWVASGQSNMEWSVAASLNPAEEAKNATHPLIRMIKVKKTVAESPQEDIIVDPGTKKTTPTSGWAVSAPDTAPSFSAVGYYFARSLQQDLKVPVGIINTSWGGTICEAWTSKEKLASEPSLAHMAERKVVADPMRPNPNQPTVLYNAMIAPITSFGIRGAIWYQGESNVGRAAQYRTLFPAMIVDWRARFGQGDFPFLFVQLAPFNYGNQPAELLAEQWESQSKTLALPNTGMCVTTDIGDIKDIHPKNKQEVGRRLALWALANNYGKSDLVYSGPLYDSMTVEGSKVKLKFKHVGGGLASRDDKPLSHFTIAGEDKMFVPATAVIEGDSVVVSAEGVAKPVAVRFAWNKIAEPNFGNKAGLPASPFRTDDFPLTTANNK